MKKIIYIFFIGIFSTTFLYGQKTSIKKYNRIISLSMAGDEMLFDLVGKDRILAFSGYSNKNEMASVLYDKLDRFTKVDNVEKIIDMEPDLVIAANLLKKDILSQLEDAGINVYIYSTSSTYEEQKNLIMELAELVEEKEKGNEIVRNMDERLAAVQKKIKESRKISPRVLEYSHYEGTNGKGSIFDDMLQKIYVINTAREAGIGRFAKISKEKVIEINPDVIIVPIWDSTAAKDSSRFLEFLSKDKSYKDLKAVKNGRIYPIPGKYVYIYSQYVIDGIEELANSIYQLEDDKE